MIECWEYDKVGIILIGISIVLLVLCMVICTYLMISNSLFGSDFDVDNESAKNMYEWLMLYIGINSRDD